MYALYLTKTECTKSFRLACQWIIVAQAITKRLNLKPCK
jgi:hypothetical protein